MHDVVLKCERVCHGFGSKPILNNVSLEIARGQIVALVGPSGCGKSTLLRAILGTHPPNSGRILMDDQVCHRPHRDRGIVYQRYSLFPFLTAEQNVAFGLMLDQTSLAFRLLSPWRWIPLQQRHLSQAAQLLDELGLGAARRHYPSELSGGMQQRVAIAQALIVRPKLLLLDEPFGALDEATREELQLMLLNLYQENLAAKKNGQPPPYTILIVTHELNEAIYVSDRVLGLSQYHATGSEGATIVYDKPAPIFHPDEPRDFESFVQQKNQIRDVVFDETSRRRHGEYITYWKEHETPGVKRAASS